MFLLSKAVHQSLVVARSTDEVKTEGLLKENYEYDLTKLIVVRKNSKKPELVVLEDLEQEEGYVSSVTLREKNSDRLKNQNRYKRLEKKLAEFSKDKNIEHVQPVYLYTSEDWTRDGELDTPSDFDLTPSASNGNHWYYEKSNLRKTWQSQDCFNGEAACGGSSDVVVAVIDTGLAFEDHTSAYADVGETKFNFDPVPDMFTGGSINLWTNTDEIPNNKIDDDNNGYIDDYHGVNTENYIFCKLFGCSIDRSAETGHPNDDGGHGTYVTGLIASLVDNGSGSISPAHNVTIMPIKANFKKSSSFGTYELVEAINYAKDNGADIINLSLAGPSTDYLLEQAINSAYEAGVLIVAASGNGGGSVYYPAKYPNVLAVGAVKVDNSKTYYSAYGPELDLVAYVGGGGGEGDTVYQMSYTCFTAGTNCYNSTNTNRYTQFSSQYAIGTSFAAPQAAAAAALIIGNNPGINVSELKLGLLSSATDIGSSGFDYNTGYGVIDFLKTSEFNRGGLDIENFTVYRYINGDRAWIWIGNPSEIDPVFVNVNVAGVDMGTHVINPQVNLPLSYKDLFAGPVRIIGSNEIHVSHKARSPNGKLNETVAIPAFGYGTEFYYPIYRYVNGDRAWLWIANPSQTEDANISITLNKQDKGVHTIDPGGLESFSFPEEFSGPLVVSSNKNIFTTLKMSTGGGLEELTGISSTEFATTIYYPVYRYVQGDGAWIWVGNPDAEIEANISVEIAGSSVGNYTIPPGENISLSYPGVFDGPVVIQSDQEIYSTMKARTGGVINEFRGLGEDDFATVYHYPIYRYIDGDGAWIWIGNPGVEDTEIDVYIAGELMGSYTIAAEDQIALSYPDVFTGPVKIVSETPIYSTLKSRSFGTLNEFTGIHD